jgi:hypothetical protein
MTTVLTKRILSDALAALKLFNAKTSVSLLEENNGINLVSRTPKPRKVSMTTKLMRRIKKLAQVALGSYKETMSALLLEVVNGINHASKTLKLTKE